jgi:hypothetical protein
MNPFKNRKKVKDDLVAPRPSVDSETSSPFRMFGRKKSQDDGAKPELDLSTALPSNDDFRTSLLMTGLSARFSMLREQDDPNTKVGKASDDSVLYPNRQSRMADFGFGNPLQDIAEVDSIRAPYARADSFHSSDDGASVTTSIMNRGKPLEGNTLFGGKQRIYKISAGSKSGTLARPVGYDDDMSHSAFQKWRLAEREKENRNSAPTADSNDLRDLAANEMEDHPADTFEPFPSTDRDRRRETNSTTSSGPSIARNSTAATSITSNQPLSSVKDWQAGGSASSGASAPGERSVSRARRLYEQSLNQDLHEHQSSALSRIDTLSKQRAFGSRTPDLSPMANSPIQSDRALDRRPLLAKSSAPALRSFTPPALSSAPMSPPEASNPFPAPEQKSSFGGMPPLSPPMSESEDHMALPIQGVERTKPAAAMFSRPLQSYDETKYAQRQRQLQEGRETPDLKQHPESNATGPTTRSPSVSSSAHGGPAEKPEAILRKAEPVTEEKSHGLTFFADEEPDFMEPANAPARVASPVPTPQLVLERPDDHDHPALRKNGTPTHLNLIQESTNDDDTFSLPIGSPKDNLPEDSPTLGPNSGLSGMVRQHLRNTSIASSIYDPNIPETNVESRPQASVGGSISNQLAIDTSCLDLTEADWDMAHGHTSTVPYSAIEPRTLASEISPVINPIRSAGPTAPSDQDDFARHLADGARRVREKLNSYVESDSGPPSPMVVTPSESGRSLSNALRPNGLGILKSKSSRGSLIDRDRSRSRDNSITLQPRATKMLGIDTLASSPTSPAMRETPRAESPVLEQSRPAEEKENVHVGLKAFRQARRELQRMKELEAKQRHLAGTPPLPPTQEAALQPTRRPHERGPPPSSYQRSPSQTARSRSGSRSESRTSERDRSGSDASNGGRSRSRPARLRNGSAYDEHSAGFNGLAPNAPPSGGLPPRPNLALRSPVPPGMDSRRSPISPHPMGGVSPGPYGRPDIAAGGKSPGRNIFEVSHNHGEAYRPGLHRPGQLGTLPAAASSPNLHGSAGAPPVPPINPRRKTRHGAMGLELPDEAMPSPGAQAPVSPYGRAKSPAAVFMSEDDGGPTDYRRRLRKVTSESSMRNGRPSNANTSPPRRPPMPPMPVSAGPNHGGLPGGVI